VRILAVSLLALIALAAVEPSTAGSKPPRDSHVIVPAEVGMSTERLNRIATKVENDIADGLYAGGVVIISRDDQIVLSEARGFADRAHARPMSDDTIVRLHSMTKPVIGVAALMLFERGAFRWSDPVSAYIPEFADVRMVEVDNPEVGGESEHPYHKPSREIQVIDLARHTPGWSLNSPLGEDGEPLIQRVKREAWDKTLREWIPDLVEVPLAHQPGEAFAYGVGSLDVLGRLVEVWSGQRLDVFLQENIFEPLGMVDTGFDVSKEDWDRVATVYATNSNDVASRLTPVTTGVGIRDFKQTNVFLSGASGLYGTAADAIRFVQMLVNDGQLDGVRLLSPKTVDLMASDVLEEGTTSVRNPSPEGWTFGIAVAVSRGPGAARDLTTKGAFLWSGYAGAHMWVDRAERLGGVFFKQVVPFDFRLRQIIQSMSYQAIVVSLAEK